MSQMRWTWLPQPGASLWWVPLQGVDNQSTAPTSPNPSQRYSGVAQLPSRGGRRPPCRPSCYIIHGQANASKLIGYWPLTWSAGTVYIKGVGAAQGRGAGRVAAMFLYHTRGLVPWVGGVHYGDMEAMNAEGQARLEPPRNPAYASTGYCMLAVGHVESGVVGNHEYAAGNEIRRVTGSGRLHGGGGTRTKRGPLLLRRMRAALYLGCCFAPVGDALAFCLLLCCCVAVPCPLYLYPRRTNGPASVAVANAKACSCHCPQSLVGRYPRFSGSSVMLWATSGSLGTHGIEQEPPVGARCPVTPVDGMISDYNYDYDYDYI